MTKRECAIIMAHTGICMLVGDDFNIFHKYCEDLLGHPIFTHQFPMYEKEIKERSFEDFKELCACSTVEPQRTYTDAEIQKMQDLEQAQFDTMFQLGYEEGKQAAQPQRIKGRWIDVTKTGGAELWKCSECGELELEDSYFCPNCGAKMEVEHEISD